MESLLFCVSSKGEEFIASVEVKSELAVSCNLPGKLVVKDYSKDSSIWKTCNINLMPAYKLTCVDNCNVKDFSKFGNYLFHRQKAGIVELENNSVLYIFPPTSADPTFLACQLKASIMSISSSSTSHNSIISTTTVSNSSSKLDSLLSKITNTAKLLSEPTFKPNSLSGCAKAASDNLPLLSRASLNDGGVKILNHAQILENEVRTKLKDFNSDQSSKCLKMPPMDKSDRYIVHDLVACEFPELLSDNVGEESDRYAIIYKKGFKPEELSSTTSLLLADHVQDAMRRKHVSKTNQNSANGKAVAPPNLNQMTSINVNKRDRRTTEEIMTDIKRKKLLKQQEQN